MTPYTVAFPIAFSVLAAVLLWFIIGAKGKWILKALAIVGTLTMSILLWASLDDIEGWASSSPIPETFKLLSFSISEPSNTENNGYIYIWVLGVEESKSISLAGKRKGQPRAHIVPYSRKLHQQLAQAGERMSRGRAVEGKRVKGSGSDGYMGLGQNQEFVFYDMPPPKLPEKVKSN